MRILAVDTSSQAGSCALWNDGILQGEFFLHLSFTHSQTLMPMVESLLEITGCRLQQIDFFAVSTGPGSFTGLRIGISTVKGMAMALHKPCIAVSTLAALAENMALFDGIILPVMDARRRQVYTAEFESRNGEIARRTQDGTQSVDTLRERVIANPIQPVVLVGDGAAMCKDAMADLNHVRIAPESLRHQRAGSVAVAAARLAEQGSVCSAESLHPAYLRLPQAERERMAKLR